MKTIDSIADSPGQKHIGYQIFVLALSVWAIAALAISAVIPHGTAAHTFLEYADVLVCGLFFIGFAMTLALSIHFCMAVSAAIRFRTASSWWKQPGWPFRI